MPAHRTVILNVVGLTPSLLGENTPQLLALARDGVQLPLRTITPAVTCSVQSTFLTGLLPGRHGIVANGWYFRDLSQVWLWRQSNRLVSGEKVWEAARRRDPAIRCAKMFWWYNMYSSADFSVTPRPIYAANGRKIPDIYTHPSGLRDRLLEELGPFPFFNFWGPKAGLPASEWIAEASLRVFDWESPELTLIYLPHLDYNLQRLGPDHPGLRKDVREIDRVCGRVIEHSLARGARVIVLSEYGITPVAGPIHVNRILREQGWLRIRSERGLEAFDAGASGAFAVADHQVAHVYVRETHNVAAVKRLLESVPGIEQVLDEDGKRAAGVDHPRSGELVAISEADRWFTYYYWLDDAKAPDFARTVDIHNKPGYDPVELFVRPDMRFAALRIGLKLLKSRLGFRTLLDVIPLDASLVKGSHGRITDDVRKGPVFISSEPPVLRHEEAVPATDIKNVILDHLFG